MDIPLSAIATIEYRKMFYGIIIRTVLNTE